MDSSQTGNLSKLKSIDEISMVVDDLRTQGKKLVMAHGVFDLLHMGHVLHLKSAKSEGDILFLSITADQFVNKGPGRPVFSHHIRAEMLAALEYVDFVIINMAIHIKLFYLNKLSTTFADDNTPGIPAPG